MTGHAKHYLPAAGHDWALPFYDTMAWVFGADKARKDLLRHANVQRGHCVLDVGCGTGTFATSLKRLQPDAHITGLDPDPKALARAQRKTAEAGVSIAFDRGSAHELPYADASFDRVVCSFVFHHLPAELRPAALREMRRVLKPRGSLYLLDFGGPDGPSRGLRERFLRANRHTRDNFGESIPKLMREAGFADVERMDTAMVLAGPVSYYRGNA